MHIYACVYFSEWSLNVSTNLILQILSTLEQFDASRDQKISLIDKQASLDLQPHKMPTFDVEAVRARFPALAQHQVYLDNAGSDPIIY